MSEREIREMVRMEMGTEEIVSVFRDRQSDLETDFICTIADEERRILRETGWVSKKQIQAAKMAIVHHFQKVHSGIPSLRDGDLFKILHVYCNVSEGAFLKAVDELEKEGVLETIRTIKFILKP